MTHSSDHIASSYAGTMPVSSFSPTGQTALSFQNVFLSYRPHIHNDWAIFDLSFTLPAMRSVAVVGESGSGKTSFAKLALHLIQPTQGTISLYGTLLQHWMAHSSARREYRHQMQLIFQDPDASLNPKHTMESHLQEALSIHFPELSSSDRLDRITQVLSEVCLSQDILSRYSFEMSGGQKQRLIIARALLIEPTVLLLDEPLSSLDASLKKSILSLLQKIKKDRAMTYLYVTHDLSTVCHISEYVMIMYRGMIVEEGPVSSVFSNPTHPYTQLLFHSIPKPNPTIEKRKNQVFFPERFSPLAHNSGCIFSHRCPFATDRCTTTPIPVLTPMIQDTIHLVRCHYAEEISSKRITHPLFSALH